MRQVRFDWVFHALRQPKTDWRPVFRKALESELSESGRCHAGRRRMARGNTIGGSKNRLPGLQVSMLGVQWC